MLVLSRDCDTSVRIGPDISVKVLAIRKQRVKLGIDAPAHVRVWRDEIAPQSEPPQRGNASDGAGGDPLPILVVEDDPAHADLIARALGNCLYCPVTIVPTGQAALEALQRRDEPLLSPHLILLDLCLPDMPGLEVLREIRAVRRFQTTPIVILSAERSDSMVTACLQAGANAFVPKAISSVELGQSVSRIAEFFCSDCRVPVPVGGQLV